MEDKPTTKQLFAPFVSTQTNPVAPSATLPPAAIGVINIHTDITSLQEDLTMSLSSDSEDDGEGKGKGKEDGKEKEKKKEKGKKNVKGEGKREGEGTEGKKDAEHDSDKEEGENESAKIKSVHEADPDSYYNENTAPRIPSLQSTDVLVVVGRVEHKFPEKCTLKADLSIGTLDLDNVIFTSQRVAVGFVEDVFGPVKAPFYAIRFYPSATSEAALLMVGSTVYTPLSTLKLVMSPNLLHNKGCDASNLFDEEINVAEMEYSDDEKEQAAKKSKKQAKLAHKRRPEVPGPPRGEHSYRRHERRQMHSLNVSAPPPAPPAYPPGYPPAGYMRNAYQQPYAYSQQMPMPAQYMEMPMYPQYMAPSSAFPAMQTHMQMQVPMQLPMQMQMPRPMPMPMPMPPASVSYQGQYPEQHLSQYRTQPSPPGNAFQPPPPLP